jgi:deoxyribodipyrimidine photo-lyase
MSTITIWWIRRDLRLHDNAALRAAQERGDAVVPLFILDPFFEQSDYVGVKRRAFLYAGLRALDADLRTRGSRLIVRRGHPAEALRALIDETNAAGIFAEEDYSPYARRRDGRIAAEFPLRLAGSSAIRPPGVVLKQDGAPYVVYTPFMRAWKAHPPLRDADVLPAPAVIRTPSDLHSEPVPSTPALPPGAPFPAGEAEAQRRLRAFGEAKIYRYDEQRNRMDLDGTSQLSPYLRFGMLSARAAAAAAWNAMQAAENQTARGNAEVWLNELIWRDFYLHILAHFPHVARASFYPQYREIPWRNDTAEFEAWRHGRTGYPVIDAAMRQLAHSGWMHNRARMIVASFLVKDLLINWQWGERWFMQQLVDGDLASNNGGWQWSAGTGTDAAPYFRIFNPITQGQKFDPDGRYIRRWIPELAHVSDKYLHEPWKMPVGAQRQSRCQLGSDYPYPIIDHKVARQHTLDAYKTARARHA